MPRDLGRGPHQRIVADLVDLHHIIRHQAVSPLNQLQGRFALADAAFPHNQQPFAVYIDQHPMDGNARRKLFIQDTDNLSRNAWRFPLGTKDRHIMFLCNLKKIPFRNQPPAKHNARNIIRKKRFNRLRPFFRLQLP